MKKGFTLVELLVVITILSILMAVLLPNVLGGGESAKMLGCQKKLRDLHTALGMYAADEPFVYPYPGDGGEPEAIGPNIWVRLVKSGKIKDENALRCPFDATRIGYSGPKGNMNGEIEYESNDPIGGDIVFDKKSNHGPTDKKDINVLLKSGKVIKMKSSDKGWEKYINKVTGSSGITDTSTSTNVEDEAEE